MPKVHEEVLMRKLKKQRKYKEKQRLKNKAKQLDDDNRGEDPEDNDNNKRAINEESPDKTSIFIKIIIRSANCSFFCRKT